jgi:hypothetical protein
MLSAFLKKTLFFCASSRPFGQKGCEINAYQVFTGAADVRDQGNQL